MLVLGRRQNESIKIGDNITITILDVTRGKVRVGIEAPREVAIVRTEIEDEGQDGGGRVRDDLL